MSKNPQPRDPLKTTLTSAPRSPSGPNVSLSSRAKINCLTGGLRSVRGAQEIISLITARRTVTSLILGHNSLGDDGCIVLFAFLQSAVGRKYRIAEISVNSNRIGDRGLLAIAEYLTDNDSLRELFLQNNNFTGEPSTIAAFAEALNSSQVQSLSLANNNSLSDAFVQRFLPALTTPHLRELYLSAIGLLPTSIPYITAYLSTSTRCSHLHTFKCNANSIGARGVNAIIGAIESSNFKLLTVELYSNQLSPADLASLSDPANEEKDSNSWRSNEQYLRHVLGRNKYLKQKTEEGALRLLRYARPLLLHHSPKSDASFSQGVTPCSPACACIPSASSSSPTSNSSATSRSPKFTALPIEIQHHILSFFASDLSPAQRIRILHYATAPTTLPQLLPCLSSSKLKQLSQTLQSASPSPSSDTRPKKKPPLQGNTLCVPDPSTLGFGQIQGNKVWNVGNGGIGLGGGCAAGKCLGSHNSVLCHREQDRVRWLEIVGCAAYDAER